MTVSDANQTSSTDRLIRAALVVSLLVHLLVFSLWKVGKAQGWWQSLAMPRWVQLVSKAMMPLAPPKKPAAEEIPLQTPLTFVEVDPSLATAEPPKKPLFQGAKNTVAANPEIKKLSAMPNIDGKQTDYLKTIEDAKTIKPAKAPPAPTPKPAPPKAVAHQEVPKQSYLPGDLAMNRPSEKAQTGKANAEPAQPAQAASQPQTPAVPDRPRTLADALARKGIPGERSKLEGGVGNISAETSLDVKGTPLGDYIDKLVEAVRSHWFQLLENQSRDVSGQVRLRFRLHNDGRVTEVTPLKNEVGDALEIYCERSLTEPAPYGKWPDEMSHEIGSDHYDFTFTFYYGY